MILTRRGLHDYVENDPYTMCVIVILLCVATLLICCTLVGNTLVCLAVIMVRKLRSQPSNYLLVSLAIADMCVGVFVMPLAFVYFILGQWPFGQFMCDLWTSADVTLCTASILSLCAISVDRYSAITRPLTYGHKRTSRLMLAYVIFVWVTAVLVSSLPPIAFWKPFENGKCSITDNAGYQIYATLISFYIPATIILMVNYKIFIAARRLISADRTASCSRRKPKIYFRKFHACASPFNISILKGANGSSIEAAESGQNYKNHTEISEKLPRTELNFSLAPKELTTLENISDNRISRMIDSDTESISGGNSKYAKQKSIDANAVFGGSLKMENQLDQVDDKSQLQNQRTKLLSDNSNVNPARIHQEPVSNTCAFVRLGLLYRSMTTRLAAVRKIVIHHDVPVPQKRKILNEQENFSVGRYSQAQDQKSEKIDKSRNYSRRKIRYRGKATERRALKTLGLIIGCFLLCWLPFFTVTLLKAFFCTSQCFVPGWIESFILWLGYANSTLNPILYATYNQDFRMPFQEILCCRCRTLKSSLRKEEYLENFGEPERMKMQERYKVWR